MAVGGLAALAVLYAGSWRVRVILDGLIHGHSREVIRIEDSAERVVVSRAPRLVADYYPASGSRPLVILVPGSAREGRRSGLCRLVANRLCADGFPVLALDLRGFGDSEDPALPLASDFRFEDDVVAAATYALIHGLAPHGRIVYMGHSLGAGVILRAGHLAPRPEALIAIGAPATHASLLRGGESWKRRFARERFSAMRMAPDPASIEVMGTYLVEMDVIAQLSGRDLPPTLLVYGEEEKGASSVGERVLGDGLPCDLKIVPDAPHAYHIVDGPWGIVFYNREMLGQLVSVLEGWMLRSHRGEAQGS